MTDKPGPVPDDSFDDPPQKQWRLKCDNDGAARRALYAAWAQLEGQ
jgi:hypothetical protein